MPAARPWPRGRARRPPPAAPCRGAMRTPQSRRTSRELPPAGLRSRIAYSCLRLMAVRAASMHVARGPFPAQLAAGVGRIYRTSSVLSRPTVGYKMFEAVDSPYLAPFDGTFVRSSVSTEPPDDAEKKSARKKRLGKLNEELAELQAMMYALNQHAVLLVFQALDAAGKDGTIRAVMQGVDPAGIQLFSF